MTQCGRHCTCGTWLAPTAAGCPLFGMCWYASSTAVEIAPGDDRDSSSRVAAVTCSKHAWYPTHCKSSPLAN